MAYEKKPLAIPFSQEKVWSVVRLATVRPKQFNGEQKLKNGVPVFAVEVVGYLHPSQRTFGQGADYYSISVPMTLEQAKKLDDVDPDTPVSFEGLVSWSIDSRQFFTADSVKVVGLPTTALPQVK